MAVTAALFRRDLPEFADSALYPNSMVEYWLTIAGAMVSADRWGTLFNHGVEMFAAHHCVLEREAIKAAAMGGVPGKGTGPINNKSVDKVSVGYDTQAGAELGAGHWNLTVYGTRFIRTARMMGAGGVQIGVPVGACGADNGAWPGPWPWNFPNMNG